MVKKNKNIIKELTEVSNYFGQRFDLIQAAGGNSSIKNGKSMYIKSSGYSLAELDESNGYSIVDNEILVKHLDYVKNKKISVRDENKSFKILKNSLIFGSTPSIETLAHSILNKYTIHLHPVGFNMITVQDESSAIIKDIFKKEIKDKKVYYINYKTPGIALAQAIFNALSGESPIKDECCFILENHGIISSSTTIEKLYSFTEKLTLTAEKSLKLDFNHYKQTTKISNLLNSFHFKNLSVLCSDDLVINNFMKKIDLKSIMKPLNPDSLLYCGISLMDCKKNSKLKETLKRFIKDFSDYPRVIKYMNKIYFVAPNVLKAKEIEDVFKSHLFLYSKNKSKRPLSDENIARLESYNPQKNRLRFWFDYESKK